MISILSIAVFLIAILAYVCYAAWCIRSDNLHIMHYLYLWMFTAYVIWIVPLIIMWKANTDSVAQVKTMDCITYIGALTVPAFFFCICLAYVRGEAMFRKWMLLPFAVPVADLAVIFTDSYHHLQYEHFSVIRSEIEFGPHIYISGAYSYLCLIASIVILMVFAFRVRSRLCWQQAGLLITGAVICLAASAASTAGIEGFEITAAPVSFAAGIVLNGVAIYRMHLLDIRPASEKTVLTLISDSYAVLSKEEIVISCNDRFRQCFAAEYMLRENRKIDECSDKELLAMIRRGIHACGAGRKTAEGELYHGHERDMWYSISVSAVKANETLQGYAVVLRDVTELHRSLEQAASDRERLKEHEHLVFLGQMIGGLAHNFKSPIMGIAGCTSEIEALNSEIAEGLKDKELNDDDIREIVEESEQWCERIRSAAGYMSDVITVIRDQAVDAVSNDDAMFTAEEVYRRCELLLKHELLKGKCSIRYEAEDEVRIFGSLNCMVQAAANMISNAIYSQAAQGGGEILFKVEKDRDFIRIKVIDSGGGISDDVREQLFRSMVTTKGSNGTGIGLYISNSMIKSRFGGRMYAERPEYGASVVISIPIGRSMDCEKEEE